MNKELKYKTEIYSIFEISQVYVGKTCAQFVGNQSVYIIYPMTQKMLEEKLMKAFQVIEFSK